MPTYDYHCTHCQYAGEVVQKITDAPLKNCPKCSQETLVRGVGGGAGLSFGPGFYSSGYASSKDNGSCRHNGCGCASSKTSHPPS